MQCILSEQTECHTIYVRVLNVGGNFEIDQDSSITLALKLAPEVAVPEKKNWADWFLAIDSNRVRFNGKSVLFVCFQ